MIIIIAGTVASIALVALSLAVGRTMILASCGVLTIASITQYAALGETSALIITSITGVYLVGTTMEHVFSWLNSKSWLATVALSYIAAHILTSEQIIGSGLLILAATLTGFIPLFSRTVTIVKTSQIITSGLFLVFSCCVGAWAQVPGQAANMIITLIVLLMVIHHDRKHPGVDTPEVHELLRAALEKKPATV